MRSRIVEPIRRARKAGHFLVSGGLQRLEQLEAENQTLRQEVQRLNQEAQQRQVEMASLPQQPSDTLLPSIVLNTLPKSGSVFIATTLAQGLGLEFLAVSQGYFPSDLIEYRKMQELSKGGRITQAHFDASPMNLQILRKLRTRMVLHLRDPRQALLSWVHHMDRLKKEGQEDLLWWVCPTPPEEYYEWPLDPKITWNIENYLPFCIRWIGAWLDAILKSDDLQVMVTTYEDFIRDGEGFICRMLDLYGIPRERFRKPTVEKTLATNYRKGETQEWRDVFSDRQKQRALESIPEPLLDQFNWAP